MTPASEQILAEFLTSRESGQSPTVDELLRTHPDSATEIREYLALNEEFARILTSCVNLAPVIDGDSRFPVAFGSYTLLADLGTGGMGLVFQALHRPTGRVVALKMLRSGRFSTDQEQLRFRRESSAVMQLDHPRIVPVYVVDEWDGHPFFTMRLMIGGTLLTRFANSMPCPREAAKIVAELSDAVQHAHQRGLLHRDIKPSNILFDETGCAYLADFGLAKYLDTANAPTSPAVTITGTPGYMSPEQRTGTTKAITTATDIYGLGGILHYLLTGKPPGDDDVQRRQPNMPRDLDAIRQKALAEKPEDRYATVQELKLDLQRYEAGQPVSVRTPRVAEHCWRRIRLNPLLSLLAFSTALALVSASYFAWRDSHSTRRLNQELANSLEVENNYRQQLEQANRSMVVSNACQLFREGRTSEVGELLDTLPQLQNAPDPGLIENLLNRWTAHDRRWACHDGVLLAMAVHPDGRSIATVGSEGRLVITDTTTGDRLRSWSLPRATQARIAYDSSGKSLAVTVKPDANGSQFPVQVYSTEGVLLHTTILDWTWLHGLDWCSDGTSLVLSGQDRHHNSSVTRWEPRAQQFQPYILDPAREVHHLRRQPTLRGFLGSTWSHHRQPQAELVVFSESPNDPPVFHSLNYPQWLTNCDASLRGDKLAAVAQDGNLFLLDRRTMKIEWQRKEQHSSGWHFVRWSDSGDSITLYLRTAQGTELRVLDAATGEPRSTPSPIPGQVSVVTRSVRADQSFYSTGDGKLSRRQAPQPVCEELRGHTGEVWAVAFHPDGQRLASGSDDGTIRIWDLRMRRTLSILAGHTGLVMAVAFSPDGHRLYSTSWDQSIRVWDVSTGTCVRHVVAHDGPIPYVAVSPDGNRLYTHGRDGRTKAWDTNSGELLHTLPGDARKSVLFALSADGHQLAVSDANRQIQIWDTRHWSLVTQIDQAALGCGAGVFSRDGSELILGRFEGVIETRKLKVGSTRTWCHDAGTSPTRLSISGDDRFFLVANDPSSPAHLRVVLSDRTTGKPILTFPHPKTAFGLAFSPDSRLIATGCHDGLVRIWGTRPAP